MRFFTKIYLLLLCSLALSGCVRDLQEPDNTSYPIKLVLLDQFGSSLSWTKLTAFGFKSYIVVRGSQPTELYADLTDIPSTEIVRKIFDESVTSFEDSTILEAAYYRVYGVANNHIYPSNEVFWQSSMVNFGPIGMANIDAIYDDVNQTFVIRVGNTLRLFDPATRTFVKSFVGNFSSASSTLPDFYVGNFGMMREIILADSSKLYFFDPLTLQSKDTIILNNPCNFLLVSNDSLIHVIESSAMRTFHRSLKSQFSTVSSPLSNIDAAAYTSEDEIVTGDFFDGWDLFKYDRSSGSLTQLVNNFKGTTPNEFNTTTPILSSDGAFVSGTNGVNFFVYDKALKLKFTGIVEPSKSIVGQQMTPNGLKLVQVVRNFSTGTNEVHLHSVGPPATVRKVYFSKLVNFARLVVSDKYVFIFGPKFNTSTKTHEIFLETILI